RRETPPSAPASHRRPPSDRTLVPQSNEGADRSGKPPGRSRPAGQNPPPDRCPGGQRPCRGSCRLPSHRSAPPGPGPRREAAARTAPPPWGDREPHKPGKRPKPPPEAAIRRSPCRRIQNRRGLRISDRRSQRKSPPGAAKRPRGAFQRSEEHTSELQSRE